MLLWGSASLETQEELSRKMIRMHILANSDSEADQTLKLQVRDRVLSVAEEILRQAEDMAQAAERLEKALPQIIDQARQEIAARGYDYPVTAELVPDTPLPAGDYCIYFYARPSGAGGVSALPAEQVSIIAKS